MTTATPVADLSDLQEWISKTHVHEPKWLLDRRLKMAEEYHTLPLPTRHRTPLKNRRLEKIPILETFQDLSSDLPSDYKRSEAYMNLVNGTLGLKAIPHELLEQGVLIMSMQEALLSHSDMVESLLGHVINDTLDKFQALNAALWNNGLFLYVPKGVIVQSPITIVHSITERANSLFPRSLIIADQDSSVTVIENYLSEASSHPVLVSGAVEIICHDNSKVHYGSIQNLSQNTSSFLRRWGDVGQDATLKWSIGEFGAKLAVSEHNSRLTHSGGQTDSITVFFGSNAQHQDYTANSSHIAPHTKSNMIAKGIMKDTARSVFTGVTDIKKGAFQSDGRQKEQTLMLSKASRADAIPSLLIEERDVFAAHAASAGPVDQTSLFYLMGRGLTEQEAIRLIVYGFLSPVIDNIPLESLRNIVWDEVERKLAQ